MTEGGARATVRKRGLKLVGIAVVLVVLVLVLMGVTQPTRGPYPGWVQLLVHGGWLGSVIAFAVGLFHAIVGAPGAGVLQHVRVPIGIVLGLGGLAVGGAGGFVLSASLGYEGDRTQSRGDDVDWDWD
jgi:hypothetical protein